MADAEKTSKSYPGIPTRNWWDLRTRFKQAVPSKVDPDYLQAVLGVGEGHAKNLIPQLKAVGLIDQAGKPTELAHEWRDDAAYRDATGKIIESIYPQGLRDALPPPNPDRASVESWFSRNVKVGEGAARRMASFYLLLCDGDLASTKTDTKGESRPKRTPKQPTTKAAKTTSTKVDARPTRAQTPGDLDVTLPAHGPSVHVDVQVHISPDASAEQIDQIFAAMAKHFYKQQ
jgi:hypothetical protein